MIQQRSKVIDFLCKRYISAQADLVAVHSELKSFVPGTSLEHTLPTILLTYMVALLGGQGQPTYILYRLSVHKQDNIQWSDHEYQSCTCMVNAW